MMTQEHAGSAAEWPQSYVAADLREWVSQDTLVRLALTVVQTIQPNRLDPAAPPHETRGLPPRMILTLLTYCYAVGIYSSHAIEERAELDDTIRYLCARQRPRADLVRRFRHRNREIIAQCLERVCLAAGRIKFGSAATWPNPVGPRDSATAAWMWPLLRLQIACEAKERLNQAEAADFDPSAEEAWAA